MLILLSPAKTLDFTPTERNLSATKPALHSEAKQMAAVAKELSPQQVAKLMSISESLSETAHGYFQSWRQKWDAKGSKQAMLAFQGDVYQGFDADTLTDAELEKSQQHIRLLSGLYGVLRPLDLMQPYRLEMGTKLKNARGKDLYAFWRESVTQAIEQSLKKQAAAGDEPTIVNLASQEYAGAVQLKTLPARVVTPAFKDLKNGNYKVISFFAKRARGMLARHLVQQGDALPATLRKFRSAGYRFNRDLSTDAQPVFTRDKPPVASV